MKMKTVPFKWLHLKYYKIEQKLLMTYPVLILISILVISFFAVHFSKQLHKERSVTYANSIIKQISRNIDTQLSRVDQDSYIFYHNADVNSFYTESTVADEQEYNRLRKRLQEFMVNFLLTHSDIESVYLISPNNQVLSTVDSLRLKELDYYREMSNLGDGKIVWLNVEETKMGNQVIPLVRNINDLSTMETNGVLLINYRTSSINTDHNIGIPGKLIVLDQSGVIITSDQPTEIGLEIEVEKKNQLTKLTGDFFIQENNENTYYVYHQSEFTNWIYLYGILEKELFSGIDRVRNLIIIVALLFSAIAVITARVISYNISKPIYNVIKEMRNIERNELLVNLKADGADELYYLATSFNNMMDRLRSLILKESQLQRMQHELEMKALQAEINPHFLYNTLDAINWTGRIHRIPEICEMTSMLADIMRYSISYQRELVTLEMEFEHIKKYIGILQIRYKDKLSVFFDIPEQLMKASIPKLTLQPIVENAIIHGVEKKVGLGILRIVGHIERQSAVIRIEDNGCGISLEVIDQLLSTHDERSDGGVGIRNVNKRLQLFFGDASGLKIESVIDKGTRVIITLPM